MKLRSITIVIISTLFVLSVRAGTGPDYLPEERRSFSNKENLLNFSLVYAAQWGTYLVTQKEAIEEHGTFKKWYTNPTQIRFDYDSFDYNIFKHTLSGQFYYLFYRSQGHTEKSAFFWTILSSLAFEFTIETVTENPSFQDIYQTPVFGTVAGVGIEKFSRYLHGTNNFFAHGLAYLINPLSLLPSFSETFIAMPTVSSQGAGIMAMYEY